MVSKIAALKWIILILAEVEMLFFSGIGFGQNSLFPALSDLKYFCIATYHADPCADQNKCLGYLLITTIISYSLVAVPIGIFYDTFGNSKTKIIGACLISLGCLAYALSSVLTQYLAYVAAILLGALAQTLLNCNFALTSLFPRYQNILVSIFTGSFDSSNFMMTFVTLGHRSGISILASFLILTFVGLAVCTSTAILCHFVEKMNKSVADNPEVDKEVSVTKTEDPLLDKTSDEYFDAILEAKYPTLRSVLFSRYYIMQISYLTILFFRFAFFLAELNLQLSNLFPGNKVLLNNLLFNSSYIFVCAIAISPFPGIVADQVKKRIKKTLKDCDDRTIYAKYILCFTPSYFFSTTLSVIMSILILIPSQSAIYISFVAFMLMRVILFSTNGAYLLLAFPKKYFGKIFGLGVLVSGAMSFIQYGLLFEDFAKLSIVNYVLIAIVILTYIHPLVICLTV